MVLLLRGSLATRRMQQQRRYEKGGQKRVAHWMPSQPSGSNRGSRRVIVHGGAGGAGGDAAHSNNSSRDRPNSAPPNGTCIHNGAYVHHQHQHHQHHNHHQQQQQQQQHQQQQQQPADASAQPHKPANVPQHQPSFPQAGPPAPGGEGNHIETRLGIVKKNRRSNSAALAGLSCDLTLDDSADSKKKIVAYIVNQKQQPQQFLEQNPTPAVANPAEKGRAASPKQKNQDSNTHLGLDFDVQVTNTPFLPTCQPFSDTAMCSQKVSSSK
ncbi:hypothetical protein DIPPA_04066 [Diplonema papillatum]|nr:hypothetical protein DIPPA_04066 [Diplonema papillatum]